jgi:glutamate-ammonia-ligase adenylyltransferase
VRYSDLILKKSLEQGEATRFLERAGFPDGAEADRLLQMIAGEPHERVALAPMAAHLIRAAARSPDPLAALNRFERVASAAASRAALFNYLATDRAAVDALAAVMGSSRFLCDILVRNTEYLEVLFDRSALARPKTEEELAREIEAAAQIFPSARLKSDALRRLQRRGLLRIAARDLMGLATMEEAARELSNLADLLVAACLGICQEELHHRFGIPMSADGPARQTTGGQAHQTAGGRAQFLVVAMGKLGGQELNYFSDIDLMFLWSGAGETTGGTDGKIENLAFATKLAEELISSLSRPTEEGWLYRVDMRLRPFGRSGPLVTSFEGFLTYMESWSEPWERQALIKARPVLPCDARVPGDEELASRFSRFCEQFVYSKAIDAGDLAELRDVKRRAEVRLSRHGQIPQGGTSGGQAGKTGANVKQGPGGIRDIEFIVQLLQLVGGAENPLVRERATLDALRALSEARLLSRKDAKVLSSSYRFLRNLEHRLQMAEELPLQTLPSDKAALEVLGRSMGYRTQPAERLMRDFRARTGRVRGIYQKIAARVAPSDLSPESERIAQAVEEGASPEQMKAALDRYGFADVAAAARNLRLLAFGPGHVHLPARWRRAFFRIAPELLDKVARSPDPDMALRNSERLASASGDRVAFLKMLCENPQAVQALAYLLGTSPFLADSLARNPEILGWLVSPSILGGEKDRDEMERELRERIGACATWEEKLNALRRYKRREMLRIGGRDLAGLANVVATMGDLTRLAEVSLELALEASAEELRGHGQPGGGAGLEPGMPTAPFAIVGLGKLGGQELHYASDLDVIFVFGNEGAGELHSFSRLAQKVIQAMSELTEEGYDFKVDARLRPEGGAGPLARSLEAYRTYFSQTMQAWERLALVRARPVAGDKALGRRLVEMAHRFIFARPLTQDEADEVRHLKRRMEHELSTASAETVDFKLGPGGISDIEFTVELLQLQNGYRAESVRKGGTLPALAELRRADLISEFDAQELERAYLFLRRAQDRLQLMHEEPASGLGVGSGEALRLARSLRYSAVEDFLRDLCRNASAVRRIHEKLFYGEKRG